MQGMKVNGTKIYNMGKELRNGKMDQYSLGNTEMERKTDQEGMNGETVLAMKESGKTTKQRAMATINGLMVENILVIGGAI